MQEDMAVDTVQANEMQLIDKCNGPQNSSGNHIIKENQSQDETNSFRKDSIFQLLCKIYSQLLVTVAVVTVFTEVLHEPVSLFQAHVYIYLYLICVSIFIFWGSCINKHFYEVMNHHEIIESHLPYSKCFTFGLIVFGLAGFTSSCLKSAAAFISSSCISVSSKSLYVLTTVFIIHQLYFLYKKSLSFISKPFQCFAIVHLAATNAALWLYMVLWNSSLDWQDALHIKHNSSLSWSQKDLNITVHSIESDLKSLNHSYHLPKHVIHFTSNCWWQIIPETESTIDVLSVHLCLQNSSVGMIWKTSSGYLYPLTVQYYLIVLLLLFSMWKSLKQKFRSNIASLAPIQMKKTRLCFCLSKGFYLGCLHFSVSVVIVIEYFFLKTVNIDIIVLSMLSVTYVSAAFAVLAGLSQFDALSNQFRNQSSLLSYHDIGLYIIYVYGITNLLAGSLSDERYRNVLMIIEALLMILHAFMQYIFIKLNVKSRQAVNFLILCNASLWVLESFVFCYRAPTDTQLKVYGIAWPVINRILIPCLAFYRFYSMLYFINASKFLSVEYC